MKRLMKRKARAFTIVELIVVLGIMAVMASIAVPSIMAYAKNEREKLADANAKILFMALQKEVNKFAYSDSSFCPTAAKGTYDGSTITESYIDGAVVRSTSLEYLVIPEIRKGTWVAGIDKTTKTVIYVHWVADYSVPTSSLPSSKFTTASSQNTWNSSLKGKKVVGSYPVGN